VNGPIVVVGDVLLDRDVTGTTDRLCPDAPVPVLNEVSSAPRPGGAGLAATFLASDGADVYLLGCAGADEAGRVVRDLLARAGVAFAECGYDGPTPEKIRLRAGPHMLLRLDRGTATGRYGDLPAGMMAMLRSAAAILVSDYGRGVTAVPALRRALTAAAANVPVVWDPHPNGATPVPGTRLVCPNRTEAARFAATLGAGLDAGRSADVGTEPAVAVAAEARILRSSWRVGAVAVTMGHHGAVLAVGDRAPIVIPTRPSPAGDACGAGDRFAAAAALGLARGSSVRDAVAGAVQVASAYVSSDGPAWVSESLTQSATTLEATP
jgi:D-beta-D-heptose 7-phosphate kinase / D-beta-D-heptose 1-phosphate adenosyltransferase